MAHRKTSKRSKARTILRLPDLEQSKNAVLHSLAAASSQESYGHAIDEFIGWYCSEPRLAFNRTVVLRYRFFLEQKNLAPSTINVRLAAVRRLAYEASDTGLLKPCTGGRNPPRQENKPSGERQPRFGRHLTGLVTPHKPTSGPRRREHVRRHNFRLARHPSRIVSKGSWNCLFAPIIGEH